MACETPGNKIRSKGKGRGLAIGNGNGPLNTNILKVPKETENKEKLDRLEDSDWENLN